MRDLVRAGLARDEWLSVGRLAMASLTSAQQALRLHEAAHRRVARHGRQACVFAREGDEVVVVELVAPTRVVAMLLSDRRGKRRADARMSAGVRRDLAREGGERIGGGARDVPPSLEGLEGEAKGLTGRRVPPGAGRELVEARLELAVVSGCGHQGAEDLKAQTCPSHARARRGVVVGHGSPAPRGKAAASTRDPTPAGKTGVTPSSARARSCARLHSCPQPSRSVGAACRGEGRQPGEELRDGGSEIAPEPFEQRGGESAAIWCGNQAR